MKRKFTILTIIAVAFLICSCEQLGDNEELVGLKETGETEFSLNVDSLTMHYDETYALDLSNTADVSKTQEQSDVTWMSSDETVATVSQQGIITAVKIGTTTISVEASEGSDACDVTIEPYFSYYKEPILDWGASISEILNLETLEIYSSDDESITYMGALNTLVDFSLYYFDSGELTYVTIVLNPDAILLPTNNWLTFFNERYNYEGSGDDYIFYSNDDVFLGFGSFGDYMYVDYIENTPMKSVGQNQKLLGKYRQRLSTQGY